MVASPLGHSREASQVKKDGSYQVKVTAKLTGYDDATVWSEKKAVLIE